MQLSGWRERTVIAECKSHSRLVCVTLPFLPVPGIVEQCFPNSKINYLALVARPGVASLELKAGKGQAAHAVPHLRLHLDLVGQYWSLKNRSKAWSFLEDDFAALRGAGFEFDDGCMRTYGEIVTDVASQFTDQIVNTIVATGATAIAVYGRGHWTMNSAACAAELLRLPLFVIERGILTDTYIVDRQVPFSGDGSRYRLGWAEFRRVDDWERVPIRRSIAESRWKLYLDRAEVPDRICPEAEGPLHVLVGQCSFDYNCLGAPFGTSAGFVDFVLDGLGISPPTETLLYRPHPLSPEEYPAGVLETKHGLIAIDAMAPWARLRTDCVIHTWNSTLGLEAAFVFGRPLQILDPNYHYGWIQQSTDTDRRKFMAFLNEVSILA